jgi:cyclopropane fatty-acyl-phospholipid synthase-like methyltransferase
MEKAQKSPDIGYIPSPNEVVQAMLDLAEIQPQDVLYDLGCGDGRIAIAAAQQFGIRTVGIDIDPARILDARIQAKQSGVGDRATFLQQDLYTCTFADATVVTLYLLPHLNVRLLPQLRSQLQSGARIISHDFDMAGAWPPETEVQLQNEAESRIFRWVL